MPTQTAFELAHRQFATRMAHCILERDYLGVRNMLAPWLQDKVTPVNLQAFIEQEIHEVAEMVNLPGLFPADFEIDHGGHMQLADFKTQGQSYALASFGSLEGITEANYRDWVCLSLLTGEGQDEEIDGFYDLWFILIEHEGQLCAAYFEAHELD